jgi:transcriptional regulator with XRE-family HTH domain
MYSHPQRRADPDVQELRKAAGAWLRGLRESRGLSQRDLAALVGAEYYTFVSQLETGRGRVPQDRYEQWAKALGMDTREFVKKLLGYYDPVTYRILYSSDAEPTIRG